MPDKSGAIKQINVIETIHALDRAQAWLGGLSAQDGQLLGDMIGDDVAMQTIIEVQTLFGSRGKSGRSYGMGGRSLANSIGFKARGLKVEVFTDTKIAPHGAIRDVGGIIKAFRSHFVNKRTGQKLLFIPLVKDVRPGQWKNLKFGVDFILSPRSRQKGKHYFMAAINKRFTNRGHVPTLSQKLGFKVEKVFRVN